LLTADYRLQARLNVIGRLQSTDYRLPTTDYRLQTND
jgi:hypothetical protein